MKKIACFLFSFFIFYAAHTEEDFSFQITQKLLQQRDEADNLFISPYSMKIVLSMALEGASGRTFGEIKRAIGNKPTLPHSGSFTSFQAIGIDNSYTPLPSYLDTLKNDFHAEVFGVDFVYEKELAVDSLNRWVQRSTQGMIQNLLQPDDIEANTRLILLNAVLFKGTWRTPFQPKKTEMGNFVVSEEKKIRVEMMHNAGFFFYGEDAECSVIELPFKREENEPEYICTIVLPKDKNAMLQIEKKLSSDLFQKYTEMAKQEYVDLTLPKVKLDFRADLKQALQALGVHDAFTSKANFSRISPNSDLFIDKIFQKTHLKIDENGLDAAAATAAVFGLLSIQEPAQKKVMHCDHPFFLFISERTAERKPGQILFTGRISTPR